MEKINLSMPKWLVFFVFLFATISMVGQQNNTLQLLQTNAADYDVKVFAPSIHAKIANVTEAAVQKKFKSINGLIAIDRSQQGYFILKLDKLKAKDILQIYFQLSPAQTSILP